MSTPRRVSIQVGLPYAACAENRTLTFLNEGNVCPGDRFAVGTATLDVCQPRLPSGASRALFRS